MFRILIASALLQHVLAQQYLSVEYFDGFACDKEEDMFGMQVTLNQCFRQVGAQGSGSAMVSCSAGNLQILEYSGSTDCSTALTAAITLVSGFSDGSCLTTPFVSNEYFLPFSGGSIRLNCDASNEWYRDDEGRYEMSRTTSSLEAASAIDYTQDNCVENSETTEMNYCYLNRNGVQCLPTNSDPDNDAVCSQAPLTTYAYSDNCMFDQYNARQAMFKSDNSKAGYMNFNCDTSFDEDISYVMPYSDCLGCNRFKDLPDDTDTLAIGIILAIVFGVCFGCLCCCGLVFICVYGTAAATALLCCRKKKGTSTAQQGASGPVTTPMHQNTVEAVPIPPPAGPPLVELLHVQVPAGAVPGTMILVSKSNGQQVQVVIPEGVVPGQIIEVKA